MKKKIELNFEDNISEEQEKSLETMLNAAIAVIEDDGDFHLKTVTVDGNLYWTR